MFTTEIIQAKRINMTIQKATSHFTTVLNESINKAEARINVIEAISESEKDYIINQATKDITPVIQKLMLSKYNKNFGNSKYYKDGKSTGTMRKMFENCTVQYSKRRNKLYILPPANMPNYKGGSNAYTVFNSLNYGAVRVPQSQTAREVVDLPTGRITGTTKNRAGAKARSTIKKFALKESVSKKAISAVEKGRELSKADTRVASIYQEGVTFTQTIEDRKASVKLGSGIVVIKPLEAFKLNAGEKENIRNRFESTLGLLTRNLIRKKMGGN